MELILLRDALKLIDRGAMFSLKFVKYNKKSKKGGEILELKDVICTSKFYKHGIRTIRLLNGETREFHIRLMTHFNDKKVLW
jgi:hypothetical protein